MAAFPIHYCGSIGYYQSLLQADHVRFEIHEHFVKQTHRNRVEIMGPNGVQKLVIPTRKTGHKRVMHEVEISYTENWQRKHWKSLEVAYRKSPFFEHYEPFIARFYSTKTESLVEHNIDLINVIFGLLGLKVNYSFTEAYESDVSIDHRASKFTIQDPKPYLQVFSDRFDFIPNLSILDALFCLGPETMHLLK